MRNFSKVVTACLVGALLLTPVQAQNPNPNESTPTTLYFHVFDTFNKFVTNTQPMNAEFFEVGGTNNPTLTGTPLDPVQNVAPIDIGPWDLNTIYGTSTAGPVEYDFIENGKPRLHPERGIAQTVQVDDQVQPVVTLYLDLRDVLGSNGIPTASPTFAVEVNIREGDDTAREANLDAGKSLMHGKQKFQLVDTWAGPGADANDAVYWSTYMTLWTLALLGPTEPYSYPVELGAPEAGGSANDAIPPEGMPLPDGSTLVSPASDGIVELQIPLDVSAPIIPKSEAFNIRIDWYQLEEAFGPDAVSGGYLRLFAGAGADGELKQPHMDFNIMNPVYIEFIHPQVAAGTLLIHAGVNSPWGTYDIDRDSLELTIEGPSKPVRLKQIVNQNQHVHGLHDEAAQITYLWDYRGEGAAVGDYEIKLSVSNNGVPDSFGNPRPETVVTATDVAGFMVTEKEAFGVDTEGNEVAPSFQEELVESPGTGLLAALGLLAAALVFARRRWSA